MIFPIERWVSRAPMEVLRGYHPEHAAHGVGDGHALEALVLAISAHGEDRWLDVRAVSVPPPIRLGGRPCSTVRLPAMP
jgi:hypothetical protein